MAIIKVNGILMIWQDLEKLKEYMILHNIHYEDIEIIKYVESNKV